MAYPMRNIETPHSGGEKTNLEIAGVSDQIIALALTRAAFSVDDALSWVGWGERERSKMLVVLEHLANEKIGVLKPLAMVLDHYAASARTRLDGTNVPAGRSTPVRRSAPSKKA
jgi:hypothetical protein